MIEISREFEDEKEAVAALKYNDYILALLEISNMLRSFEKYGGYNGYQDITALTPIGLVEIIREQFYDIVNTYNINEALE